MRIDKKISGRLGSSKRFPTRSEAKLGSLTPSSMSCAISGFSASRAQDSNWSQRPRLVVNPIPPVSTEIDRETETALARGESPSLCLPVTFGLPVSASWVSRSQRSGCRVLFLPKLKRPTTIGLSWESWTFFSWAGTLFYAPTKTIIGALNEWPECKI